MVNDFLTFLAGLAPEGETLLLTRQTPKLANGEIQLHADGAIKATWPAFLPNTKKRKPDEAWFANTGSFILDRMTERVSAAAANCDFCLALMLDDVGSKSKTPPLAPTWIMETSPGNFQWGYAFTEEQPTKGEFAAAIRAMADAGYTDPGALNPVRNFRIPGSVNLKPGRDRFAARLVEFHPERQYTLPAICEALGVTPGDPENHGPRPLTLADDGGDDVVAWLSERGLVYSRPNGQGWMGVYCPQADQHTDGSPEGRYMPASRMFCCLHSHCIDLDSQSFLDWVAEQGGPSHSPGLREELLQAAMAGTIGKLTPTPELAAGAQAVIDEVERKEAGRLTQKEWFPRYAYVENEDSYFDLEERRLLSRRTFDAVYRHVACYSVHLSQAGKRRMIAASNFFDENRVAMRARSVAGVTYAPGESVLCSQDGFVYVNRWHDARPDVTGAGDASRWLAHVERMIPDPMERAHVLDVMAFKLQNPGVKINHAILHGGTPGAGKDTMWAPFLWAMGGPNHVNIGKLENHQVQTQWGYHLECEVLTINELRQTESADRRALENRLKPIIAAPPEFLTIERKGQHPYTVLNRLLVVAQSNQRDAIAIGSDDRRWFVVWSDAPRMGNETGRDFWRWLNAGGFAAVAAWLHRRDVSAFNPGATPPMTDAKLAMIGVGRSMAESWLIEQIEGRQSEFARGVVGGPWQGLCDRLQGMAPPGVRIVPAALLHALAEAGWSDLGLCHSKDYKTKKHIWTAPTWTGSKAEARNAVEAPPAAPLTLVK